MRKLPKNKPTHIEHNGNFYRIEVAVSLLEEVESICKTNLQRYSIEGRHVTIWWYGNDHLAHETILQIGYVLGKK